MKQNKSMILGIVILLVALAGAVILTQRNQNTQNKAAFDTSTLQVLPASTITAGVGDTFAADLWYYTTASSKVDGVQTEVCYGSGVTLAAVTVNTTAGFGSTPITATKTLSTGACTAVVVTSQQAATNLLTTGRAFTMYFKGISAGTGNISLSTSSSMMTGDNSASATDKNITVTGVTGTSYNITGITPTATPTTNCQGGYNGGTYGNSCGNDGISSYNLSFTCADGTEGKVGDSNSVTCYNKNDLVNMANQFCASHANCSGSGYLLKFKMTYLGILDNAQCADPSKMPLTVIVRAPDGTMQTYNNVIASKLSGGTTVNGQDLGVYEVSLRLGSFNYANNIAIFVKDAKHLQVKYGVNGQSDYYNKAGGELSGVTSDDTSTPVFDFTKYPLLAGDVVDDNGTVGKQNGQIDGLDFSYVKTQSIARTAADAGGYMLADLNGNCKMESQDLSILMLSLSKKQGQLY